MTEAKSTEQIDGRTVTLLVDLESGLWRATHDHEIIASGATRDIVIKKARASLRRQKVRLSIPATIVDAEGNDKPFHVVITGLHAQNNDVLYRAVDRKDKGRLSNRSWMRHDEVCPRLTDEELTKFATLRKAAHDAAAAFQKWQKKHVIRDSEQFVKDAIEEKVKQDGES